MNDERVCARVNKEQRGKRDEAKGSIKVSFMAWRHNIEDNPVNELCI